MEEEGEEGLCEENWRGWLEKEGQQKEEQQEGQQEGQQKKVGR
jgi:hypothetical protein